MKVFDREALIKRRVRMKLSRNDVAKSAYCSNEAYSRFESGQDEPSDWWLERIARALECNVEVLMMIRNEEVPRGRKTV